MAGQANPRPIGREQRRGIHFIFGGFLAVLLLQGFPAWAQDANVPTATDAGTAGTGASTGTTESGVAPGGAVAPLAATSVDQPVESSTLRPAEEIDGSNGSFTTRIPLQVPPFHGLEPSLALAYDSGRGNGFVGVGWTLAGLSLIERGSVRRGSPRYDTTDVFLLDGEEMVACGAGVSSPSCSTGGTHATRIESFLRIQRHGQQHLGGDGAQWHQAHLFAALDLVHLQ